MNQPLDLNTTLVRNSSLVAAQLDGETVMMSLDTSRYYGLNPVGGRIWELLVQPMTVAAVCDTLQQEYNVARGQCEREVLLLAQKLIAEKLVQVV